MLSEKEKIVHLDWTNMLDTVYDLQSRRGKLLCCRVRWGIWGDNDA